MPRHIGEELGQSRMACQSLVDQSPYNSLRLLVLKDSNLFRLEGPASIDRAIPFC